MIKHYAFPAIPVLLCTAAMLVGATVAQAEELDCLAARPIHQVIEGDRAARPGLEPSVYTASALKPISAPPPGSDGSGTPAGGSGIASGSALF